MSEETNIAGGDAFDRLMVDCTLWIAMHAGQSEITRDAKHTARHMIATWYRIYQKEVYNPVLKAN